MFPQKSALSLLYFPFISACFSSLFSLFFPRNFPLWASFRTLQKTCEKWEKDVGRQPKNNRFLAGKESWQRDSIFWPFGRLPCSAMCPRGHFREDSNPFDIRKVHWSHWRHAYEYFRISLGKSWQKAFFGLLTRESCRGGRDRRPVVVLVRKQSKIIRGSPQNSKFRSKLI